jgi:hypothetical protein
VKVGIKGPGDRIKWVDIQDLPVTKELVKFKKETADTIKRLSDELAETKQELKKTKLENVEIVRGLLKR